MGSALIVSLQISRNLVLSVPRYTPGWALELSYSNRSSPLYMLCEEVPKSPLRDNVSDLAYNQPFPFYTAESQRLFFVVDVAPAELLPFSLSAATSEVGVAFQPAAEQLGAGITLVATAPVGWEWDHRRRNRNPRPQPQAFNELVFLILNFKLCDFMFI